MKRVGLTCSECGGNDFIVSMYMGSERAIYLDCCNCGTTTPLIGVTSMAAAERLERMTAEKERDRIVLLNDPSDAKQCSDEYFA